LGSIREERKNDKEREGDERGGRTGRDRGRKRPYGVKGYEKGGSTGSCVAN